MSSQERKYQGNWIYGGIFLFLAVLLLGFNYFVRVHQMKATAIDLEKNEQTLQRIQRDQTFILQDGFQDLAWRYSDGMAAVQSIFEARKEVFSGELDDDSIVPVVLLDMPDFFERLQDLLFKRSVLSNMTIGRKGDLAFLVQTTSYTDAGKQIATLRFGLEPFIESKKKTSSNKNEDEESEEGEEEDVEAEEEDEVPRLLIDFDISSVSRNNNAGGDDVPEVLRGEPFVYSFIVQAQINPEYYIYLLEEEERLAELAAEEAVEDDDSEADNS